MSQGNVIELLGGTKGSRETGDLEFMVSLTWHFSPAMFSCSVAGTVSGELGFTPFMVLSEVSEENGS